MTGATDARDAVREALKRLYRPVYEAGRGVAGAYQQAIAKTDLVEALAYAVDLVLAADHLREVAEAAEKEVRAELARVMSETGCHQIVSGPITAFLSKRPAYVVVDDPSAIPPQYLNQPPPSPDKSAIKKAIEACDTVPGATLIRPNEQMLVLRSKSK